MKNKSKLPIRSLVAFRRIHLQAGEQQRVVFKLSPDALFLNDLREQVEISIGGGQPGANAIATSNVLTRLLQHTQ